MLIVKKFGGTSVANKERIYNVAKRCIEDYQKGNDVVVVLSAMGKSTDELIAKAKDINPNPPKRELDMLVSVGEQFSQISGSSSTETMATSSGILAPILSAAAIAAAPIMSVTANTPHGRGTDLRTFAIELTRWAESMASFAVGVTT